ncbi:hypothetical protein PG994_005130 [Apiospora phragmitis]|uniref:Infection structure specific protein n=1 Tax=Apiospora phragmitis TaxID=2905665 RepID=A0ABR1VSJ6_9PEZI
MYNQVLLSAALAGLASTVGATYNHAAANQLRDLSQPAHVVPRQPAESSSGSSDCTESAVKLIAGLPTPTGDLLSYYATASALPEFTGTAVPTNLGSACAAIQTQSLPSALSAPMSSYESTLVGWYSSHTSDIMQLMSACSADPMVASAESLLAQVTKEPACMSLLGGSSGMAMPIPTPTGDGQSQSTSKPSEGAAPKPTAMAAGAMAAAGFFGAVAML